MRENTRYKCITNKQLESSKQDGCVYMTFVSFLYRFIHTPCATNLEILELEATLPKIQLQTHDNKQSSSSI